jgi:RNA polymerase sigma factor (sigma-70 family)
MSQLEALFKRLSPVAFSVSLGILKSREEARDVVQEVFAIKLPRYFKQNPGKGNQELGKIALAMTKNLSIDIYRRQNKSREILSQQSLPVRDADVSETIDIKRAMSNLEPRYREVLTLKYIWGLTWLEIARRLGLTVKVARNSAERGVKEMKKSLIGGSETNG